MSITFLCEMNLSRSQRFLAELFPEHLFASQPGLQHIYLPDFGGWNGEIIAVNHNKIRPFSRFKTSRQIFLMCRVSRMERDGTESFCSAKGFFGVPATWWIPGVVLAGDG